MVKNVNVTSYKTMRLRMIIKTDVASVIAASNPAVLPKNCRPTAKVRNTQPVPSSADGNRAAKSVKPIRRKVPSRRSKSTARHTSDSRTPPRTQSLNQCLFISGVFRLIAPIRTLARKNGMASGQSVPEFFYPENMVLEFLKCLANL